MTGKVAFNAGAKGGELSIELTAMGRRELLENLPPLRTGLAMVIDGVIHAIADNDHVSADKVVFSLPTDSPLTKEAIVAGIRGPKLPVAFELMED